MINADLPAAQASGIDSLSQLRSLYESWPLLRLDPLPDPGDLLPGSNSSPVNPTSTSTGTVMA